MSLAGLVLLVIGLAVARKDLARARGIEKAAPLAFVCFGMALAGFGAEHLFGRQLLLPMVPRYMPERMFWVYFVGCALLAAALSIATKVQVRWSALLVGVLMFLFVAMLHFPGALRVGGRTAWTVVVRELSFGGGAWVLAGVAMGGRGKGVINVGRVLVGAAAVFFGVEHFLHPLGLPGVPLMKQMPSWVPARQAIDYITGALLIGGGMCFLLDWKARLAAAYVGSWIVLTVVTIYVPVLIGALANSNAGVKLEGLNYFYDTLLFGAVILALAVVRDNPKGGIKQKRRMG